MIPHTSSQRNTPGPSTSLQASEGSYKSKIVGFAPYTAVSQDVQQEMLLEDHEEALFVLC